MVNKLKELNYLIGNTPLLGIRFRYKNKESIIYTKCEHYNFSGSVKDRMALYILQSALETKQLTPDSIIVEATSGNTGIAFAAVGSYFGNRVRIIMPD